MKKEDNNNPMINNGNNRLMGKLAEEWQGVLWNDVLEKLSKIKSKKELQEILESLLAEDEKKMILRRLAAASLIKQGKSYQQIGEVLWISPATISTIKKNLLSKKLHHTSHRSAYNNKQKFTISANQKETFSEIFMNFLVSIAEDLEVAFSSKGVGMTNYARRVRPKFKTKKL